MNTVVRSDGGGGGGGGGGDEVPSPGIRYANRVFTALSLASLYILLNRRSRRGDEERFFTPAATAAAASLAVSLIWLYLLPLLLQFGSTRRRNRRRD